MPAKTTAASGGLDFAALDTRKACNIPIEVELKHPVTGEGTGGFVGLLGKDSDAVKDHIRSEVNGKLRRDAVNARKGKFADPLTMEQLEKERIELLIVATTHFKGIIWEGSEMEFSYANAQKLYSMGWVRDQLEEAQSDLERFMKA